MSSLDPLHKLLFLGKKTGLKAKLRQDQYKETQKTQGRSDFLNQKRLLCSLFLSLYYQV